MKYAFRNAQNVFMYGSFCELVVIDVPTPLPYSPKHWCNSLECLECWNAGVRYADHLKAKRGEKL